MTVDRADGAQVRIAVADDGVGLPQEDRARLTEPYVTHKPKGTGLGLAIVKKIMEDHGGSVTLDDRQGTGCRFERGGGDVGAAHARLPRTRPGRGAWKPSLEAKGADGA